MKVLMILLGIPALTAALACDEAPTHGPAELDVRLPADDLIDLLPSSTLVAVELRDLDSRWDELRAIPPLSRLQDHLLSRLGLEADDVPEIAGPRMLLALVTDEAARRIVPVAVLDPPFPAGALSRLAGSGALAATQARGAIWAGPADQARRVERIAAGDGTRLRHAVDLPALGARLPAGGLARAVVNPRALSQWLRRWAELGGANIAGSLPRLLAADLEAVELIGVRRDIVGGELVTDAWVGIDREVVPGAVARALAVDRGPALLPDELPPDVLLAKSFRTEPEAGLAWLRALAARDPGGPLRHLDFWIDEFEARSGRNVETDIVAALGERGLALVLQSDEDAAVELVVILDAADPERLGPALVDLRDWLGEYIRGRTLGLAIPARRDFGDEPGLTHALDFWSPFGTLTGPVFRLAGDRLVVATSRRSLVLGVELAGTTATWSTPSWALAEGPPDEIAWIRANGLARVLIEGPLRGSNQPPCLDAIAEFLAGAGEGRVRIDYEERGVRVSGRLGLDVPGRASKTSR